MVLTKLFKFDRIKIVKGGYDKNEIKKMGCKYFNSSSIYINDAIKL